MLGSIVFGIGIIVLISAVGSGAFETGVIGVVLIVAGLALFWRTSATRAYLKQNKRY